MKLGLGREQPGRLLVEPERLWEERSVDGNAAAVGAAGAPFYCSTFMKPFHFIGLTDERR